MDNTTRHEDDRNRRNKRSCPGSYATQSMTGQGSRRDSPGKKAPRMAAQGEGEMAVRIQPERAVSAHFHQGFP
jgi:hypothetical protein